MCFHGKFHLGNEVFPPKKQTWGFCCLKTRTSYFFETSSMKRSLKAHSACHKSSKSCTLLFFYGHPSSKILSFGPRADLYSCLDFFCVVLWLVDALLCKMSAFEAAFESKWSKKKSNPFSLKHSCLLSPMDFPKWEVLFPISCFSECVWCWTCWGWGSWELSCLESFVEREQSQHAPLLCYCVHMFGGFLPLLQVNHAFNGTGNFLSA